jgi:hypothetical protein
VQRRDEQTAAKLASYVQTAETGRDSTSATTSNVAENASTCKTGRSLKKPHLTMPVQPLMSHIGDIPNRVVTLIKYRLFLDQV